MALVDDPRVFILRMFQMEEREGRGAHCQVFPGGTRPPGIQLSPDESVFGIYKGKYFFSPRSLSIQNGTSAQSFKWSDIAACSTVHGCGKRESSLTLLDGSTVVIQLHELATGWAGRTSQLFHGMIERWGSLAPLGPSLVSLDEFAGQFRDPYQFAPNLEPHPSTFAVLESLRALASAEGVHEVRLSPVDDEGELVITRVVIVAEGRPLALEQFSNSLRAAGVVEASRDSMRKANASVGLQVWEVLWD